MLMYLQRLVHGRKDEKGASAVEYGLLVAAIAAIIVLIVFVLGKYVKKAFSDTCTGMSSSVSGVTGSCT
jgi:pilus assembly protein Flp/PilA